MHTAMHSMRGLPQRQGLAEGQDGFQPEVSAQPQAIEA